jgi:hypothetical protein
MRNIKMFAWLRTCVRVGTIVGCGAIVDVALTQPVLPVPVEKQLNDEPTTPQAAVAKVCTACHGIEIVMDTPKDYDAWHDTVQDMIDRGADGTPAEFDLIMQYLLESVTTVNVNHSDPDLLGAVLHAPPAAVDKIIARRKVRQFKDLKDLESSIPGLNRATLEEKKRMIFFQ